MRPGKRIILFLFFVGLLCTCAQAAERPREGAAEPELLRRAKLPRQETAENISYPFSNKDRDPLSPLVSKSGQLLLSQELDETGLHLQGIIYAHGNSVAIINGEVVKEKGIIGNYTVVTIEQKKVILKKGNEEFTLKLEE